MGILILLRHGQSEWNKENRFTGWIDVDLSERGIEEARAAGDALRDIPIDIVFTSALRRAIRTAEIVLERIGKQDIPLIKNQALNERHYGDLQGLNKDDVARQYGLEQFKLWRRSYDVAPPNGESLKMTSERVLPYYESEILPHLREGKNVLIVAHGNSLRALVMALEKLTPAQIVEKEIPTGIPFAYIIGDNGEVLEKIEDIAQLHQSIKHTT
ncbi:MAG: 2,3-diphosphoglycerate-dependent phosphoglycerate mutase [Bacteroidota bacterium]|nr:2,3-diphosphoglycerate-dependent phosphoglycerate mutase [Candidatus Kapabacteria bacterium]MCS7302544.1 2,3-diphosphoglycerate-dependent phosphoglycerate mutase [Candidatus Kapabacteria bacterium]MDW8074186.1 2,3-diphosphoglycerate-dependent phosphoglycerate mutase [Bacteroidota bacterium]MDW8271338.1 2,3-diphosphoglycerate-dependent phosphoglycerate mutase [Bacteroidota bacterium]